MLGVQKTLKKKFYFHKLIYWNLTGWEIQERFRACASVSYRWLLISLKYKDTKRAMNWIPNLDDPWADVVATMHPWWRPGLVLAERAASWGAGPSPAWALCHSDAGRCQGEMREQHSVHKTAQAPCCLSLHGSSQSPQCCHRWPRVFLPVPGLACQGKAVKGTISALMWTLGPNLSAVLLWEM